MKLKEDIKLNLPEGVDLYKFDANRKIATKPEVKPKEVRALMMEHGYNLDEVPGAFIKFFNKDGKELNALRTNLEKIDNYGLREIFNYNLSPSIFSTRFVDSVEFCIHNNLPYLNSDNTFIRELYNAEAFGDYSAKIPVGKLKTAQEIENYPLPYSENKLERMDAEDKQVYNEVVSKLNYLLLANPTDEYLAEVVNNTTIKIVDAVLRKEYKFSSLNEMISNVMFDGLATTPVESARIEEIVSSAFPEEERKLA